MDPELSRFTKRWSIGVPGGQPKAEKEEEGTTLSSRQETCPQRDADRSCQESEDDFLLSPNQVAETRQRAKNHSRTAPHLSIWRLGNQQRRPLSGTIDNARDEFTSFDVSGQPSGSDATQKGEATTFFFHYWHVLRTIKRTTRSQVECQLRREFFVQLFLGLVKATIKLCYVSFPFPLHQDLMQFLQTIAISLSNHKTIGNPATAVALVTIGSLRVRHWALVCCLDTLANTASFLCVSTVLPLVSGEEDDDVNGQFRKFYPPITVRSPSLSLFFVFLLHILSSFCLVLVALAVASSLPRHMAIIINASCQVIVGMLHRSVMVASTNPAYVLALLLIYRGESAMQCFTYAAGQMVGASIAGVLFLVFFHKGRTILDSSTVHQDRDKGTKSKHH